MMDVGWSELARYLGGAFALYLVLEGILPFVNPAVSDLDSLLDARFPTPLELLLARRAHPVRGKGRAHLSDFIIR